MFYQEARLFDKRHLAPLPIPDIRSDQTANSRAGKCMITIERIKKGRQPPGFCANQAHRKTEPFKDEFDLFEFRLNFIE
jgi:hypothetical protein